MRILFEPIAGAVGLGAITRCLALAQAAALRGHSVAFHAQPYPLLEDFPVGDRYDAVIPTRPRPLTDPQSSSFSEALGIRGLSRPDYLREAVRAELKTIEQYRPDVIVTEWQPSVPIAAHAAGVPFVATLATTELSRLAGRPLGADAPFHEVDGDIVGVAREYGIDDCTSVDELLHLRSLANIAPTVPELEPLLTGVPHTHFVGPLLFPPLELRRPDIPAQRADKKILVYLGAGAVSVPSMVNVLGEAFPAPEYDVLVAAREREIDGATLPLRRGSVAIAHEPGLMAALQDCSVAVLRGSQNAVAASLMCGVPIVGLPGDRDSEPMYNMQVIEAHGCGRLLAGMPSPAEIATAAAQVMADGSAERAGSLGALLRGKGGPSEAITVIERALQA
ncbi:glycosyltransferase [Streptomyces sp. NPDC058469]|uniref:glycosyltransferase n=1 Tax=Streptomyces sp. NPDC058469 TaxID=3346514 RepID=UPI00366246D9